MWRYIGLSLVVHGFFVLVFWFVTKRPLPHPPSNVQVEFVESKNDAQGTKSSHSAQAKSVKFKNLLSAGGGYGRPKKSNFGKTTIEENMEDEVSGYATNMDVKTQLETMHFYQAVWNKINEKFFYPLELAEMYIEGDVVVHLEVDRRGTFKGRLLKMQSTNPLLEAFTMGVVMLGLKHPLNERYWHATHDAELIPLSLTFHYRFYLQGVKEPKGRALKNRLQFERYVRVQPKIQKQFYDFLKENHIPMIIPIPGGFYMDVVQVVDIIRNINKPGPKALEQKQRDLLKDQFERIIKENSQGP